MSFVSDLFVSEHKYYECELSKLKDRDDFEVYALASSVLSNDKHGYQTGHGGVAAYWSKYKAKPLCKTCQRHE